MDSVPVTARRKLPAVGEGVAGVAAGGTADLAVMVRLRGLWSAWAGGAAGTAEVVRLLRLAASRRCCSPASAPLLPAWVPAAVPLPLLLLLLPLPPPAARSSSRSRMR